MTGAKPVGDAVNVLSFIGVLSFCLAVTIFAFLRITHLDPRVLVPHNNADTAAPAPAVQRPVAAPLPAAAQVLELHLDNVADVVSHGSRANRAVALTFNAEITPTMARALERGTVNRYVNDGLLTELRQLQVPATFFLAGLWIDRYPDVARAIGADPLFEVGSQSYGGEAFRAGCPPLNTIDLSRAGDDIERNQTLLSGITTHPTRFFRFPGGCYDATSLGATRPAGLQTVQYDVVAGDTASSDPATIIAHTLESAQAGSIVVLDLSGGDAAPATDRAVPEIVRQLRARGFKLVTVSDLLATP